jgi:hypothetical protein
VEAAGLAIWMRYRDITAAAATDDFMGGSVT